LVKALQKDGKVTEDDREAALKEIQTLTDKFVGKVDDMMKAKEADVMTV
jgi:ribosome recycling factor